ncbi:hypothetical protein NP233_g3964 [Leucocoprinus birnbaumii]|uniref:HAMP domain-containing protein n=1 Tax=Leucocoprinus birnbaumii TaxID=56174 RepID=A0AAD5W281_9AGAR|nr:hypothetical protein NP233_g3964 [Leucocoprinus birnbaumii]
MVKVTIMETQLLPSENGDAFLDYIASLVSTFQTGNKSALPVWSGPRTAQTDAVIRAVDGLGRKLWNTEEALVRSSAGNTTLALSGVGGFSESHTGLGGSGEDQALDEKDISVKEQEREREGELGESVGQAPPASGDINPTREVLADSSNAALDTSSASEMSASTKLKQLEVEIQDITRICTAISRGDLSQRIIISNDSEPGQNTAMNELKDVVNTMIGKLDNFAREVIRVSREVGKGGILGTQVDFYPDTEGSWRDLVAGFNGLAGALTDQTRCVSAVAKAVDLGDFSELFDLDVQGEFLDMNPAIIISAATLENRLSSIAYEVNKFALSATNQGKQTESFVNVPDARGMWDVMTRNVNRMYSAGNNRPVENGFHK